MNYRYKTNVKIVRLPQDLQDEDRGLTECCDPMLVMADLGDTKPYKNDFELAYLKLPGASDSVEYVIEKCGALNNPLPNYGEVATFPQDTTATGFIYDWKQYLANFGQGLYKIYLNYEISGITGSLTWGQFELKNFSITNALNSCRVHSYLDSYSQKLDIDFTGSNCHTTLRFKGYFGKREPQTKVNNLITQGRRVQKVTRENLNVFKLETNPISNCISSRLLDFHFLHEDTLLASDHNMANHDYQLFDIPVAVEESAEVEYYDRNRKAKISILLGDRDKTDKTFYNTH